ncbi:MAG: hypothetical protein ACRC3Y_13330 [Romboutsia sp.]|uniref:hypothetical protein n=1 Tax=Romboutsia sp. TaxID=1965302 RepID=UPI003F341B39
MQKIGISKSKENNRKYFTTLRENKLINFENIIDEINSVIIKPNCINLDLIKNNDKLRLTIKTDIKIIYLKKEDTALYVYKDSYINYETIDLPKIIEGHYIYDNTLLNKIKNEVFVENINTKLLNNSLLLSYFLSMNIDLSPTYYIAYSINNGFSDNLFLSHINGQALTQKTFNQNMKCNEVKWNIDGSKVCYLASVNNIENIYCLENVNDNINRIVNVNVYKNINTFLFKNDNEIIINTSDDLQSDIYIFNLKRNQLKKLTNQEYGPLTIKPHYDTKNKLLYFLSGDEKLKYLYTIDEKNNTDIIFNYVNVIDYYVSYYSNSIIIKVFKDNKLSLFLLDRVSKFLNPIPLQIPYEDILDIKFVDIDDDNKNILILIKNTNGSTNGNSLLLYNLTNYNCKILIQDNINKIDIDYITLNVFLISIKNNLNYIEKININNLITGLNPEVILKLPASIKDISIKKVANEK